MSGVLRKTGFTLIELMIVVAIIGVLAAIAIPAFGGYLRRSKATEAFDNLRTMSYGAAAYYEGELWGDRTVAVVPTSRLETTHCTVPNATTLNVPSAEKHIIDWDVEAASFEQIGFGTRDPVYFQYAVDGSDGSCGHEPFDLLYSFRAHGDLDGDGIPSLYEISAGATEWNELMRSPGVYIQNPYE